MLLNLVFLIRIVSLRLLVNIEIPTQDFLSMFGAMKLDQDLATMKPQDLRQREALEHWG